MKKVSIFISLIIFAGLFVFTMQNANSAEDKVYNVGDKGPAGGWIFYDKGKYTNGWRYLEISPKDQRTEDQKAVFWGCVRKSIPGAEGIEIGTGKSNTQAIIKSCKEDNCAAQLCTKYHGGGKSDWFLPSMDELKLIYVNLYKKGIGSISDGFYWSSSESGGYNAWKLTFFDDGCEQSCGEKDSGGNVIAIRAF